MAINITKIVQISKGSRFGDGEWQEDMRKLGSFKTAYDKANDKGMKVYKNKWYDYVKIVADRLIHIVGNLE